MQVDPLESICIVPVSTNENQQVQNGADAVFHPLYLHNIFDNDHQASHYSRQTVLLTLVVDKLSLNLIKAEEFDDASIIDAEEIHQLNQRIVALFSPTIFRFGHITNLVHKIEHQNYTFYYGAARYLKEIYLKFFPFILFYIETASLIEFEDLDWECIVMMDKREFLPIGLCSYYRFRGLGPKRIRLSQFVVLPWHQKGGNGSLLYDTFYEEIVKGDSIVDELTVEDPNEYFQRLREFCDARMLHNSSIERNTACMSKISAATKLPKKHLELICEILDFKADSKDYRLKVKKRLFRDNLEKMQDALTVLENCPAVTVACISGICIGAGIELALACDLVYCCTASKFCIKETVFGFAADLGLFQRGAVKLGKNSTLFKEYGFTSTWFDASIAAEMGLVGRVFADSTQLINHVKSLALESCSKHAIKDIKDFISHAVNHGPLKGLDYARIFNSGILMGNPLLASQNAKL